ncbi:ornithine acetyltransferase; amino-acid acetyltransferase [Candidatus Hydrogenisulfobacillus filiaventi]|uniref:Arginine biosynthesis bifunctional protein ArgJ n=1 Tax=Candidatus Hydrogenisulfobacillus filiaventi TaxID=2707344 RepID=A0A6F8ZJM9_9FIRM|nr:bifunctional glutamate N-acetyltransferase/amino-acid acetyltransferase ArgJ [Bacillota bacterium]CAB1129800.1 ornithine acetyltransferase; amino-acid acetyltransferase [Candidatus Hydrogenisulfobacillus filiaventi]
MGEAEAWRWLEGANVAAPYGYWADGVDSGVQGGRPDLALLLSDRVATFSGLFTTNAVQAAPVRLTREIHRQGRALAVVVNSGNANAVTGEAGEADARRMQELTADAIGAPREWVAVASTGVIGVPMPMDRIAAGIRQLGERLGNCRGMAAGSTPCHERARQEGAPLAARAILTTDTRPKTWALEVDLEGGRVRLGVMAKGSGMIHPGLATMLVFITTDAAVEKAFLDAALREAVDRSLHRLTVDGDQSTNDMVLAWANGASGVAVLSAEDRRRFAGALTALLVQTARAIAADGEGATHLLTVTVRGAASEADAALKARRVAGSSLVKAAVYGRDPNWGRVLAAAGSVGDAFDPGNASLTMNGMPLLDHGRPLPFDEAAAARAMEAEEVVFELQVGDGPGAATAWGCDLTEGYVHINAHYRT